MRLRQYLTELTMRKGTKIRYKPSRSRFDAHIELERGDTFRVDTISMNERTVRIEAIVNHAAGKSILKFREKFDDGRIWDINFTDYSGTTFVSPKEKGVAVQLFAALLEYMKEFKKRKDPQAIAFTSRSYEKTRIKLYDTIAKRIKKQGFEFFPTDDGEEKTYYFFKSHLLEKNV